VPPSPGQPRPRTGRGAASVTRRSLHPAAARLALLAAPGQTPARRADLITGTQRRMDTLGLPTYAEAFTEADRDLLGGHGYAERAAFPISNGAIAHPMWRTSPFWTGRRGGNAGRPAALNRSGRLNGWALR
ncbi:hypothetical protein ABZ671_16770, partial [Micromonospora sp. NPDC006766]